MVYRAHSFWDKPLMVSTLALKLLDKLTDQVIAYALEQSGLEDKVRVWLKKAPRGWPSRPRL